MIVPQNILQTLKCSMCCNFLSIFPVHYYSNEEKMITCGRCPVISELQPQRQVVYEMTAKHMKFPCQYQSNGCVESLFPQMLEKHESVCNYRTYFCPMLPLGSCPWQGQSEELYEHYSVSHEHYTHNEFQMELDLVDDYSENYMFTYNTMTFVAHISCVTEQDEFMCAVRYVGNCGVTKKYLYQVVFSNDSKEVMKLPCGEILASDINAGSVTKIREIQSKLNSPTYVVCKIEILAKTTTDFEAAMGLTESEKMMLQNLECPVCFSYMTPPIHQCTIGHSLCGDCVSNFDNCPTCSGPIQLTRNFSLEQVCQYIKYPCKYSTNNCPFISTSNGIRNHEKMCVYGSVKCPIEKCSWTDRYVKLIEHVQHEHKDALLDLNNVTYLINPDEYERFTYVTTYNDDIFTLQFEYDDDDCWWCLQFLGSEEGASKYFLDLHLTSPDEKEKIFVRKQCISLSSSEDARNEAGILINTNMLKNIITDNTLSYTYRIVQTL